MEQKEIALEYVSHDWSMIASANSEIKRLASRSRNVLQTYYWTADSGAAHDALHRAYRYTLHCEPGQVEPAYTECGNGAVAMKVSQVNLFELGPTWLGPVQISSLDLLALPQHRSHIQCKLVQLVRVYSV